jgi:FtsZ-binding cell division protein ZapB
MIQSFQRLVTYAGAKMVEEIANRDAEIEELKAYNAEILSASAEIRARANELDRSNLQLAKENKRLREIVRSYAESTEKCHYSQTKDTED